MKKRVFGRKLSRDRGSRLALFRSLIKALILHGEIITTKAKAKSIQPDVDKLVVLAKKNDINARRIVYKSLANDRQSTQKLFGEIAKTFANKVSGYTRIINLPQREGDMAKIVRLEWSEKVSLGEKSKSKKGKDKISSKTENEAVKPSLKSRIAKLRRVKSKK